MHGTVTGKRKNARSAITNGSRLFAQRVDLRTSRGGRFKDLIETYSDAIGPKLTEAHRVLVRDLAMLQVLSEDLQQKFMQTDYAPTSEDHTQYSRMSTNIKANLRRLGLLSVKPQADDDDELSPLEYMKTRGKTRRARLDDDEEED